MSEHAAPRSEQHEAAEEHHDNRLYLYTWLLLLGLTLAALGVEFAHGLPRLLAVAALLGIMLVKAGVIAANFMHLRFEHAQLVAIAFVPLLLLLIMFVGMVGDFGGVLK